MTQKECAERFEKLYNLFTETYLNFYTWKGLQDKAFEKTFAENSHFWTAVLFALQNSWLTGLAKIFENSTFSKKAQVISVYALLPHQTDTTRAAKVQNTLTLNAGVIKGIQQLRNNQLAHNNTRHLLKPKLILSKFPIKYAEVEQLLLLSGEILSDLNPKKGHGYAYKMLADDSENDGKQIVKKLQYYSKLHREHLDKFRRREIHDHRFPPL